MAVSPLRQDCTKVVFRIENQDEAFIDLYYVIGDALHVSSEMPRPQHAKHNFDTCSGIEIKTKVSTKTFLNLLTKKNFHRQFHPQRGENKRTLRALWDWFVQYVSLRTLPVFINFSEADPGSTKALLTAINCPLILRIPTYGQTIATALTGKTLLEVHLVESNVCSAMPAAPKITVDAALVAEHRDYRDLLQPETKFFHYIAARPMLTDDNWAALFQLNVDKILIQHDFFITKEFSVKDLLVITLNLAMFSVLDNCHRARGYAKAKSIEVHFAIIMNAGHMALLQSQGLGTAPMNLSDVRRRILQDPFIPATLIALHYTYWNHITFKITFGNGVIMETLVDDTAGANPAYNLNTLVHVGRALGW
uniref:NR LBD domain-containing protein n=1 Tax=Panagrellus redivivus TaxID=6233 RepID=A0A7E4UYN1_PANRE